MATPEQKQHTRWLRVYTLAFHACWVLIAIWAARQRFSLPPEPLADRDVWGYLSPALVKIAGGPFIQSEGRGFVYPGFIYLVLTLLGSINPVTVIQHVLGLATGLLLLANWMAARRFLIRPLIPFIVYDLLGLGVAAVFLLSAQSTFAEHHLRPEAILPFFAMLQFGLLIQFLLARYTDQNRRRALWLGAACLGVSFVLPLLKPSFSFTVLLTTLPIWWQLFDREEKLFRRLTMVGAPVLAALVLLWIPESRFAAADPRTQTFLPSSLFTIHALQIRVQMASDLAVNPPGLPYSHEQLQSILNLLDSEIETSRGELRHNFAALGFNPDYLLYEDSFCRKLPGILPDRAERSAFYRFYFRRTWRQQPGMMLHKFVTQMGLFYNFDCPVYSERASHFDRAHSEMHAFLSEPSRAQPIAQVPAAQAYLDSLPRLAQAHIGVIQPKLLKALMPLLGRTYLPIFLLTIAAVAWLLLNAEVRAACGWFGAVVALGFAYNLGNNIAIALFHSLGVGRYSHVQLATTLLTQTFAVCLLIELAGRKLAHLETRTPVAAPSA